MRLVVPDRRLAAHGLALAAVTTLVLTSALSVSARSETRVAQTDSPPAAAQAADPAAVLEAAEPAQRPLDFDAAGAAAAVRTQGADQQQAQRVVFNPSLGLPHWLHGLQDVSLWTAGDPGASLVETVPAGAAFLKPLGPFGDTRVQVYFPGDDTHAAAQAWVDTSTVEPSELPAWIAPGLTGLGSGTVSLPLPPHRVRDTDPPDVSAGHIAIIDEASGQLLYGLDPDTEVPQASTTKIATTIVALEHSPDLSRRIPVTVSATAMAARDGSSTMGLEPGRSVSLDTLLHGMMLPSGNDAAEQVAVALADSREQYVQWMNDEVVALGLRHTHFVNPSGMDADGHYSSAYDMAMLARYAMRNAAFRDLASTRSYTSDQYVMGNLNRLLGVYAGADGVKIGYTDNAHKTIVASATRDGHRVYVSLMHSEDLVGDSTALFNWVWRTFEYP